MKVRVLISLVLLVSVAAVPAPSRRKVKLPSDALENTDTKTKELYESYLKWKETLPEGSDKSFATFISWVENGRPQSETDTENEAEDDDLAQREHQNRYLGQIEDLAERELKELSQTEIKTNDFNQREQQEIFPSEEETDFSQRQEKKLSLTDEEAGEDTDQRELNENFPIEKEEADFSPRQEESSSVEENAGEDVNQREINEKFQNERETEYSRKQEEEPSADEEAGDDVGQREQNERATASLPAKDETEKSVVFDCETNSPCTAENAVKELFYFAAKDPKKFIQCSAFGSCSELPCREGLAWNDEIKTCNY